jgi:hypothetical protein
MNFKKKIFQKTLLVVAIIGIGSYFGYNYLIYGGERDIANESVDFEISSKEILTEFTTDIEASNSKYLEKVVAITGKVTSISGKEVTIDHAIIGSLLTPNENIITNETTTIKGRVVGYDDLLAELKLDKSLIIKNE